MARMRNQVASVVMMTVAVMVMHGAHGQPDSACVNPEHYNLSDTETWQGGPVLLLTDWDAIMATFPADFEWNELLFAGTPDGVQDCVYGLMRRTEMSHPDDAGSLCRGNETSSAKFRQFMDWTGRKDGSDGSHDGTPVSPCHSGAQTPVALKIPGVTGRMAFKISSSSPAEFWVYARYSNEQPDESCSDCTLRKQFEEHVPSTLIRDVLFDIRNHTGEITLEVHQIFHAVFDFATCLKAIALDQLHQSTNQIALNVLKEVFTGIQNREADPQAWENVITPLVEHLQGDMYDDMNETMSALVSHMLQCTSSFVVKLEGEPEFFCVPNDVTPGSDAFDSTTSQVYASNWMGTCPVVYRHDENQNVTDVHPDMFHVHNCQCGMFDSSTTVAGFDIPVASLRDDPSCYMLCLMEREDDQVGCVFVSNITEYHELVSDSVVAERGADKCVA